MIKIIKRLIWAYKNTQAGLLDAIEYEQAFRLEIFAAAILVPIAIYFGKSPLEKAILLASLMLVFIIELLNSAIETAIDRISLEPHELSRRAKDMGSAAVFLAIMVVIIIWVGVFLNHT
jgi:diacylglycerol kinase (ATP)